jgi:hypothetical protein
MNVISCTVDDQRCSPNFTDDASEVGKQIRSKIWLDQGTPSLGAEDQMQQNIAGCMGQASFAPARGFSLRCYPPTACAVGCILAPLSRLPHHHTDEGEQAVTTVTSIVVDLLWYDVLLLVPGTDVPGYHIYAAAARPDWSLSKPSRCSI